MANDDTNKTDDQGKPLDPNYDFGQVWGDDFGKTGITTNHGPSNTTEEIRKRDASSSTPDNMVSTQSSTVMSKAQNLAQVDPTDDVNLSDHVSMDEDETTPGYDDDEASAMGSATIPEADDDTLQMSHLVGLRQDEDPEHPQELNTAADVAAAERARRSPPLDAGNDYEDE